MFQGDLRILQGQNLGLAAQTGLKGGLSPPPLRIPGSFTARYRSRAMFQGLPVLPQNPAASRYPPVGLQPAQTDARFSTSPFGVIFERGHWHFKNKGNVFGFAFLLSHRSGRIKTFVLHSLWPRSKRRRMNGEKPRGCFSERVRT